MKLKLAKVLSCIARPSNARYQINKRNYQADNTHYILPRSYHSSYTVILAEAKRPSDLGIRKRSPGSLSTPAPHSDAEALLAPFHQLNAVSMIASPSRVPVILGGRVALGSLCEEQNAHRSYLTLQPSIRCTTCSTIRSLSSIPNSRSRSAQASELSCLS